MMGKTSMVSLVLVAFFVFAGTGYGIHAATESEVAFQVKSLEVIQTGSGDSRSSKYVVGTESGEVFENQDSFLELKFNSSTVQNKLEKDRCFEGKAWGFRIPLLSMYRNIGSIREIDCARLN